METLREDRAHLKLHLLYRFRSDYEGWKLCVGFIDVHFRYRLVLEVTMRDGNCGLLSKNCLGHNAMF